MVENTLRSSVSKANSPTLIAPKNNIHCYVSNTNYTTKDQLTYSLLCSLIKVIDSFIIEHDTYYTIFKPYPHILVPKSGTDRRLFLKCIPTMIPYLC